MTYFKNPIHRRFSINTLITVKVDHNVITLERVTNPNHKDSYRLRWGSISSSNLSICELKTNTGRPLRLSSSLKMFNKAVKAAQNINLDI